jgi:hypothetical protein
VSQWFGIVRVLYGIVSIGIITVAVVLDIQSAIYFGQTIKQCHLPPESDACYCRATQHDYDYIFRGINDIDCNNAATRNPNILNTNAAFSVACFMIAVVMLISLLVGFLSLSTCAEPQYNGLGNDNPSAGETGRLQESAPADLEEKVE